MRRHAMLFLAALAASILGVDLLPGQELAPAVQDAEQARISAIARAKVSAISVFARGGRGGGSGVVITEDGYALTNFHVVKPAGTAMKCSMPDGRLYDAVIVGIDPVGDVALIKMLGRDDFPAAEIADSDQVRVGDWCFAIGNPFLLATDFQPTVTFGVVSGVHRYQYPAGTLLEYADCIQTDASINPGNSGGPLFNAEGQLIGVNGRGSFEKRGRVNVGVGYAISINQIQHFMGYLRSGRIVDHATLGATVTTDEKGRVIVSNILESSDAFRRGLRYGDELIAFGGRRISTVNGFKNALGIYPRGWRVPISFLHEGDQIDTHVRLSGVHSTEELISQIQQAPEPEPKPGDDPPGQPRPSGDAPGARAPKPAPQVAKLLEMRRGYANYYFNRLNRDRVWTRLTEETDCANFQGTWKLFGQIDQLGDLEIALGDTQSQANMPQGIVVLDAENDLDTQLGPRGSGGLLVALHLWRHLLVHGPDEFGEVYYLGTTPLMGRTGLHDTFIGTHRVIEMRLMFDPENGRLVGIEMYPELGTDPCEILFDDFQPVEDQMLPHTVRVRQGDLVYGTIVLKNYELAEKPAP